MGGISMGKGTPCEPFPCTKEYKCDTHHRYGGKRQKPKPKSTEGSARVPAK
jgi:hypothetical protein